MTFRSLFAIAALSLAACGGASPEAACTSYVEALTTCYDEAGVDGTTATDAAQGVCDNLVSTTAAADQIIVDQYNCYAEQTQAADCSTAEGIAAIDLTSCI